MGAKLIDGKALAAKVYDELKTRITELKEKGVIPRLALIHIGTDKMTTRYIKLRENAAMWILSRSAKSRLYQKGDRRRRSYDGRSAYDKPCGLRRKSVES